MKKIVYPILLLVLTACKGNQQTTNNEFAAIPVAETIADTIAQPEVDAITSATSSLIRFRSTDESFFLLNVRQPLL